MTVGELVDFLLSLPREMRIVMESEEAWQMSPYTVDDVKDFHGACIVLTSRVDVERDMGDGATEPPLEPDVEILVAGPEDLRAFGAEALTLWKDLTAGDAVVFLSVTDLKDGFVERLREKRKLRSLEFRKEYAGKREMRRLEYAAELKRSREREQQAIAMFACPICGAAIGSQCVGTLPPHRITHGDRRKLLPRRKANRAGWLSTRQISTD